jgi:hypothetical protein
MAPSEYFFMVEPFLCCPSVKDRIWPEKGERKKGLILQSEEIFSNKRIHMQFFNFRGVWKLTNCGLNPV